LISERSVIARSCAGGRRLEVESSSRAGLESNRGATEDIAGGER